MALSRIAEAYVQVVPRIDGVATQLKSQLSDELGKAGDDAGKTFGSKFSESLKSAGSKMTDVGKNLTLGVTAPLVGIGIAGLKTAADFGVAMASLRVNSGASATEMAKLSDLAIQMGQDTVYSAGEAANAMLELSKGGLSTAAIQGGALASTMNLAATEGIDLSTAATVVVQAMNTFGLSAKDSATAVDLLAAGAVASTASVEDLSAALKFVGSTAATLKIPMSDTVTALAALNNAGIDSTTAGTSLNRFFLGLIPTTRKAAEEAADLGLNFVDASGKMKPMSEIIDILQSKYSGMGEAARVASLKAIFGVEGMRAANILITNGAEGWDELSTAVNKNGVAQDLANARMSGLAGVMEQFSGSVDTAFLKVGDRLTPAFTAITNTIKAVIDGFTALPAGVQTAIVTFGVIAAALGPVLILFGSLLSAVGNIINFVKIAIPVVQAFWAVLAANPVGALVAAIAVVVAALVYFFTQTELGKELWQKFVDALASAWNWLWENALKPVFDFIAKAWDFLYNNVIFPIVSLIMLAIGLWAASLEAFWNLVAKPVIDAFAMAFKWLWTNAVQPVINWIGGALKAVGAVFTWLNANIVQPVFKAVGAAFTWVWTTIIKPVVDLINGALKTVGDVVKNVFTGVTNFLRDTFNGLVGIIKTPLNAIIGFVNKVIGALNTIQVKIPAWVPIWGGKTFGINLPKIPALAEGGLVNQPTTALIGEAGPEVVTPLKDFERMVGLDGSGKTLNYYAAPNNSLNTEQALFLAMKRAEVIAGW